MKDELSNPRVERLAAAPGRVAWCAAAALALAVSGCGSSSSGTTTGAAGRSLRPVSTVRATLGQSSAPPLTANQQEYEAAQLFDLRDSFGPCLSGFKASDGGQFGLAETQAPDTARYFFPDALPAITALLSKHPYVTGPQPAMYHEQLADYPPLNANGAVPPTPYLGDLYILGDLPRAQLAFQHTRNMSPPAFTAFRLGRMLVFLHPSGVRSAVRAPLTRCYFQAEAHLKKTLAPGASLGP